MEKEQSYLKMAINMLEIIWMAQKQAMGNYISIMVVFAKENTHIINYMETLPFLTRMAKKQKRFG